MDVNIIALKEIALTIVLSAATLSALFLAIASINTSKKLEQQLDNKLNQIETKLDRIDKKLNKIIELLEESIKKGTHPEGGARD